MQDHTFIEETPNNQKIMIFAVTIALLVVGIGLWLAIDSILEETLGSESLSAIKAVFASDLKNFTSVGLFYWGLIGGLFFIPIPIELFYFNGLLNGNPPFLSLFLQFAALLPAHAIDYYLGRTFSPIFLNFISKKKVYKARRWTTRYGSYAVFFFNALPFPAPVLTFALGITRYNIQRLGAMLLLGNLVKYAAIIWLASFFH